MRGQPEFDDHRKLKPVHRMTANHDYGSFHVENPNKPGPIMIERSSYSTTNTSYGNFIPWREPNQISLLQTPESLRKIGQTNNFTTRDRTSKEIGTIYEQWQPEGSNPNDRISYRNALLQRRHDEQVRKSMLQHYMPKGKAFVAIVIYYLFIYWEIAYIEATSQSAEPGGYQPSVLESQSPTRLMATVNPTLSMDPNATPVPRISNERAPKQQQQLQVNKSKADDGQLPFSPVQPSGSVTPNPTIDDNFGMLPTPTESRASNHNHHEHHQQHLFVPPVHIGRQTANSETMKIRTSYM